MVALAVYNQQGAEVGSYELDTSELASGVNKQLLHDVVVMYEANRRVGTAATKSRGMVKGSTKKMYRQKGTGNARAGSKRSPIRRGGGHTFAKVTRDFSYRLPKKAVRLACRMAMLSKFEDEEVKLVDDVKVDQPKTKSIVEMMQALSLDPAKTLLAIEDYDTNIWKSARNIAGLRIRPVAELNAYDLLRQKNLLITQSALDKFRSRAVNGAAKAESAGT